MTISKEAVEAVARAVSDIPFGTSESQPDFTMHVGEDTANKMAKAAITALLATGEVVVKEPNNKGVFMLTDEQIKYMRDRFLGWQLPNDFRPDGGIQFDAYSAQAHNPKNPKWEPSGTNVFDAYQAEQMIRYMLEGLPPAQKEGV